MFHLAILGSSLQVSYFHMLTCSTTSVGKQHSSDPRHEALRACRSLHRSATQASRRGSPPGIFLLLQKPMLSGSLIGLHWWRLVEALLQEGQEVIDLKKFRGPSRIDFFHPALKLPVSGFGF